MLNNFRKNTNCCISPQLLTRFPVGQLLQKGKHFGKLLLAWQKITHWQISWGLGKSRKGKKSNIFKTLPSCNGVFHMKAKLAPFAPKVPETCIIDGPTFSHPHWHHFLPPIKLFVEKIKEAKQEFCRFFSCDIESYITDILVGQELSVEVLLSTLNTWECASSESSTKNGGPNWTANFNVTVSSSLLQLARD